MRQLFFQQGDVLIIYVFMMLLAWMVLQAFIYTGWKELVLSTVTGFACLLVVGLGMALIASVLGIDSPEPLFLMLLGCFVFFLIQGYRKTHTARLHVMEIHRVDPRGCDDSAVALVFDRSHHPFRCF